MKCICICNNTCGTGYIILKYLCPIIVVPSVHEMYIKYSNSCGTDCIIRLYQFPVIVVPFICEMWMQLYQFLWYRRRMIVWYNCPIGIVPFLFEMSLLMWQFLWNRGSYYNFLLLHVKMMSTNKHFGVDGKKKRTKKKKKKNNGILISSVYF